MTLRPSLMFCVALLLGLAIGAGSAFFVLTGDGSGASMAAESGDGPCPGGTQPAYWVAPMDASYRRDAPGKSPMGMDLVPQCNTEALGENQIAVSPATIQTLGVRTAPVIRAPLAPKLMLTGRLVADPARERRVHSRTEGWVQTLGVTGDGDSVAGGATLYSLFSPQFYAAESDYLAAAGNSGLRRAAAERLR
ncbi:MAG: efflux RND transporter periplasmic adaptor subunit, partial [Algiphilus sp.]